MKRKRKRFLAGAALTALMAVSVSFAALAARIEFTDPSASTGQTVTVEMKVKAEGTETIGKADVTLSYDSSLLEFVEGTGATGGAGTLRVTGSPNSQNATSLSFSLKFRALRAGSAEIGISSQEIYDSDSQSVSVSHEGRSTVTIAAAAGDSGNADLAGLQISPGTLSPSFSADVLEYTATVDGDVESLVVDAPAVDAGASVSVSGNEGLQTGENKVVCTVTAQDGQTVKTYTITVTRAEGGAGGSENGEGQTEGVLLRTPERSVTVLPVSDDIPIPEGFVPAQVSIDGNDVKGWIWGGDAASPQYCIFYATNENGETDFYRYDLTEKTLQRYFRDPLVDAASDAEYAALIEKYNALLNDYNMRFYGIIGLVALAVVLLIVIIVLVATRGKKNDFYEKNQDSSSYPERRRSERQKQASQTDSRRMSREERYMRGMEEEEEAAEQEEFRAEQQIRERQAQRRQAGNGRPTGPYDQRQAGSYAQRPSGTYAQRPAGAAQQGYRTSAGPRPSQQGERAMRQQAGGQEPYPRQRAPYGGRTDEQGYVVRGPLPGDEEPYPRSSASAGRTSAGSRTQPQGNDHGGDDDDFQVIDLGI